MKVVLYMAQTINGKIARENYEEEFFTDESRDEFVRFAEKAAALSSEGKHTKFTRGRIRRSTPSTTLRRR